MSDTNIIQVHTNDGVFEVDVSTPHSALIDLKMLVGLQVSRVTSKSKAVTSSVTLEKLAKDYASLLSIELGGKVWSYVEEGEIIIRGENLPVHPELRTIYGPGWSLLDRKSPTHCREYIRNRGCMGQSHAINVNTQEVV